MKSQFPVEGDGKVEAMGRRPLTTCLVDLATATTTTRHRSHENLHLDTTQGLSHIHGSCSVRGASNFAKVRPSARKRGLGEIFLDFPIQIRGSRCQDSFRTAAHQIGARTPSEGM